jgi:hypothetical protein
MSDWVFAQSDPKEELARVEFFSLKKRQEGGDVEFLITVKEYVTPPEDQSVRFLAEADKETNQKTAPYTPRGWGSNLLQALSDCIREIHRFPYEGDD